MTGFLVLLALVIGLLGGWNLAQGTIADECVKLGGFYVGKRVFKCIEVKHVD